MEIQCPVCIFNIMRVRSHQTIKTVSTQGVKVESFMQKNQQFTKIYNPFQRILLYSFKGTIFKKPSNDFNLEFIQT